MADALERLRAALAGRYIVEHELGHGGMATVYLAQDLKHRRAVAIKLLDPELAGVLGPERFVREIETAAGLHHAHVLPLLDSGVEGGLFYYVMPYVAGESLRERLATERQLGQEEATRLAIEVARALDYAHRNGIVHRDIKPENILLVDGQAVVADFGIARAIRASGGEQLTRTGVTLGSPSYMSPEQTTGDRDVDGRSDLYSLACVLYEMLAGQPPFGGPAETLGYQHLNLTPRPVRELRPAVSAELDAVLTRALAKTPADRFASGAEMVAALTNALRVPTPAGGHPATPPESAVRVATPAAPPPVATPAPAATAPAAVRRGRPARSIALVAIPLLAIVAALVLWRAGMFERKPAGGATARRWVWLADFEGPAEDPSLAPAARDLVAGALDQSRLLATLPIEQMRMALRNAQRPDTTRMTVEVAREMAFRSAIPVVVEGRIGKLGAGYNIVLRATRSENGQVLATASGAAANDKALVPVLTRLTRELRRALGEQGDVFRSTFAWGDAPTPSFEAFKLYLRGRDLINANDPWSALTVLRQAIDRDTSFAVAWLGIATAYSNLNRPDSVRWAVHNALRHADQLTAIRRLDAQAKLARVDEDFQGMNEAFEAMLALDMTPVERAVALNNQSTALSELGRPADSYRVLREAEHLWPIGATAVIRGNLVDALIALGRVDEASVALGSGVGDISIFYRIELELIPRRWERAESLAIAFEHDPTARPMARSYSALAHAGVRGARGDLRAADAVLAAHENSRAGAGNPIAAGSVALTRFWAARLAGRMPPSMPDLGTTTWAAALRAQRMAFAGDSVGARRELRTWPEGRDSRARRAIVDYVEGALDWRAGRWEQAIERMRENARMGNRSVVSVDRAVRGPERWLIADTYERLNQPDSAITYLRLVLDPPTNEEPQLVMRGHFEPWARSRLVRLYLKLGRLNEARGEWDALAATCTRPDPELVAVLNDTRERLQSAGAMSAGSRH